MEQSTLQEILGVEKEIREQLDAERLQASQWLEAERRAIEAVHREQMERLRHEAVASEDATRRTAQEVAARGVRQSEVGARTLNRLTDDELRHRVRECIAVITPGVSRAR